MRLWLARLRRGSLLHVGVRRVAAGAAVASSSSVAASASAAASSVAAGGASRGRCVLAAVRPVCGRVPDRLLRRVRRLLSCWLSAGACGVRLRLARLRQHSLLHADGGRASCFGVAFSVASSVAVASSSVASSASVASSSSASSSGSASFSASVGVSASVGASASVASAGR